MKRTRLLFLPFLAVLMLSLSSCGALLYAKIAESVIPATVHYSSDGEIIESLPANGLLVIEPTPDEKKGYEFKGWYFDNTSFTVPLSAEKIKERIGKGATEITVYAKWEAKSYTLTFGEGKKEPMTLCYGQSYIIPPLADARGKTFYGWCCTLDGSEVRLTDEEGNALSPWRIDSDVEIFASWSPNTVTVNLELAGGRLNTDSVERKYGASYGVLPEPSRIGYEFRGWYDENGKKIKEDTVCHTNTDSVTLYARWRGELRTVYFDYGEGEGEITQKEYRIGERYTNLPKGTRYGYDFLGWGVTAADTFDLDSPTTLHAEWALTDVTVTVTLNYNGGDPNVISHYVDTYGYYIRTYSLRFGQSISAAYNIGGTRDGYSFDGWYTARTGGEAVDPRKTAFEKNTTLYAHWSPKAYYISFHLSPLSVTLENVKAYYGEPFPALPTDIVRDGYVLVGWRNGTDGEPIVEGETVYTYTSSITLYPIWEAVP